MTSTPLDAPPDEYSFHPSPDVLDLLTGQHLYAHPSACVRELLQNAADACELQAAIDPSYSRAIVARYSPND